MNNNPVKYEVNGRDLVGSPSELACIHKATFEELPFSTQWVIKEPQIQCGVITLDNHLDNEYTYHMLQSKSLPINLSSFVYMLQAIGHSDQPATYLPISFTRLNAVFLTLYQPLVIATYIPTVLTGDGISIGQQTSLGNTFRQLFSQSIYHFASSTSVIIHSLYILARAL